jgi:hypothetical protein
VALYTGNDETAKALPRIEAVSMAFERAEAVKEATQNTLADDAFLLA